jgi:hypothetical protein
MPSTSPARVNASVVSRLLANAGHPRSKVLPGGRSGVLSPVGPGYHLRQFAPTEVHVYWRGTTDDAERRARLAAIAAELAGHGYQADQHIAHQNVPILRVTRTITTEGQ